MSCAMGACVCVCALIAFFLCTYGSHWPTCHFLMLCYFRNMYVEEKKRERERDRKKSADAAYALSSFI